MYSRGHSRGSAILRFTVAGESLWLDELHTAWVVDGALVDVAPRAAWGNQAPLYFWLSWPVVKLAGLSELSLRSWSLLAGLCLIGGGSWVAWRFTRSATAAAFVAWIFALDPTMIFYATEARPYALVQIIGLAQILLFWGYWRSEINVNGKQKKRVAVGLVVATASLFYLHYSTVLLFISEFVFVLFSLSVSCLLRMCGSKGTAPRTETAILKASPVRIIAVLIAMLLLISPTFANLLTVWDRRGNWADVSSVERLANELLPTILILVILPGIFCGVVLWLQRLRGGSLAPRSRLLLLFLATCALGPAVLAIGSDYFRLAPLALSRYVVVGNVAMILFAGIGVGLCQSRELRLACLLLIFVVMIWQNPVVIHVVQSGVLPNFRHENWQEPIDQLNQAEEKAQWPVFLFANILEDREANTKFGSPVSRIFVVPRAQAFTKSTISIGRSLPCQACRQTRF